MHDLRLPAPPPALAQAKEALVPYISASDLVLTLPAAVPSITGSTVPITIGEVATICDGVSLELDSAAAAAGYSVPIATTATSAYALMRRWTTWGAGAEVLRDIFPNLSGPNDRLGAADEMRTDFKQVLDRLRTGEEILMGAALDTSETNRTLSRSYSTSNPMATVGVLPNVSIGDIF